MFDILILLPQDNSQNVDHWDFDIFAFRRVTEGQQFASSSLVVLLVIMIFLPFYHYAGRPLFHIGLHLFQKHNLIDLLKLDILKVMKFLGKSWL